MRPRLEALPQRVRAHLTVWLSLSALLVCTNSTSAQTELPNPFHSGGSPNSYGSAVALGDAQFGGLDAFISDPSYPAVHWYSKGPGPGGLWNWFLPFLGPGDANGSFGRRLALRSKNPAWNDGWALAISSQNQSTNGGNSGAVWVASSTMSSQFFDLLYPSSAGDAFGSALTWAGDQLVVGAPGDDFYGSNAGALYLYTPSFQGGGLLWTAPTRIDTSSIAAAGYAVGGQPIAASQDWLLVGARWLGGINGDDVFIFQRSGNTFVPFASQPRLNLSARPLSQILLRGDELYINGELLSHHLRFHSGTSRWQPVNPGGSTLFPAVFDVEDELMLGYGANGSAWTICASLPLIAQQRLAGQWTSSGYSPTPGAVGGGGTSLLDRKLLLGSIAGNSCQGPFGPSWGTAWFFDFAGDQNVNGIADATDIASDPCLDRNANGVLDSTEGLWTGWVGTGGGNFLEEFDTTRNEWNWSDGKPDGRRVAMKFAGTSPATVTLDDSGQTHTVRGLEVRGHLAPIAELLLRIAPASRLDALSLGSCQAELIIGSHGRVLVDQAQLIGQAGSIESNGILEIRGDSSSLVNLVALEELPPMSRVELGGGSLSVSKGLRIGVSGAPADTGGHVSGHGALSSSVVDVRSSGVLNAYRAGVAATLQVTSPTFTSSGHLLVGESDELRISASTATIGGNTDIEANGKLEVTLSGFLPVQHSGDLQLSDGKVVLGGAVPILTNTAGARIYGSGEIQGDVNNSGRIESLATGDTITMGAVGTNLGELLAANGGKLSMKSLRNDGTTQVVTNGRLETTGAASLDNYGIFFVDDAQVDIAGSTRNLFGLTGAGLICLKDLTGAKAWTTGGAFLNDISARLEVTDSNILASSFENIGEAILSGATQITTSGNLTNSGQMCAKGGTHILSGGPWTNSGTVCIETGSFVFVNGSLLLPGGGVSWNCSCSLTPTCGSPPITTGAADAELLVVGDLTADAQSTLDLADGKLTLLGNLDVAITDPARRDLHRGTIVLTGNVQEIEMLASDRGNSGPFGGQVKGQIGTLQIGPAPTTVRLVDRHVNDGGNEVLYVQNLVLDAGTTLDLAGRTLYYESLQQDQSANVTDSVGGGQLEQSKPAFGGAPGATLGKPSGKR
ncbi:MAG: hypothetical protein RL885_14630 [Planctomycetota bacterium]